MKDKFGIVFKHIKIFKCYIAKDYEHDSVYTYIKTTECDNISSDNTVNEGAM
jgi:hypothetical protein